MALIIFIICCLVWYLPLYRKQGRKLPGKTYLKGILEGAFPVMLICLLVQTALTFVFRFMDLTDKTVLLLDALISAAVVEESFKFIFARRLAAKGGAESRIQYAMLFGAVGMGFQISESLMGMGGGLLPALMRGVLAYHVVWQYWMGLYYYDYVRAKDSADKKTRTKLLAKSVGIPVLLHFVNDYIAFMMDHVMNNDAPENEQTLWIMLFLCFFIFSVFYLVMTMKKMNRAAKESREEALTAEDPQTQTE